ncbi:MAG: stage V sporulation protein AC [Ruminococcaceae bacterium]|nr:stage V sporulation protein AC [Oscillospiraceae bacterium]
MKMTKREYQMMSKKASPPSPVLRDCVKAFLVGGLICAVGQVIVSLAVQNGLTMKEARTLCCIALIGASVLLTALDLYDAIAKHAGAGMLVPITGFANAVSSPAIEFKSEGFVLGLGAKMFTIAGPVIVYGTVASVVYGVIYWITTLF